MALSDYSYVATRTVRIDGVSYAAGDDVDVSSLTDAQIRRKLFTGVLDIGAASSGTSTPPLLGAGGGGASFAGGEIIPAEQIIAIAMPQGENGYVQIDDPDLVYNAGDKDFTLPAAGLYEFICGGTFAAKPAANAGASFTPQISVDGADYTGFDYSSPGFDTPMKTAFGDPNAAFLDDATLASDGGFVQANFVRTCPANSKVRLTAQGCVGAHVTYAFISIARIA